MGGRSQPWDNGRKHGGGGGGGGGRGGGGGNNNSAQQDRAAELRRENDRLRSQLASSERAKTRAFDRTPHPHAREREQDGDWQCALCLFKSNRYERAFCYRCTAPRHESFGAPSRAAAATPQSLTGGTPTVLAPGGGTRPLPSYATVAAAHLHSSPSDAAAAGAQVGVGATVAPAAPAQSPHESARQLRATIDRLQAARGALAGDAGCEETARQLDEQIAAARGQLAACLPVEVAVKGTIGPAAQARQAVVKAEAKLARLEQQVTSAVAAYDVAASELAACRVTLQAAEAATARAAAAALPRSEVERVLASDPGAVWAAMVAFIKARVTGMPPEFVAHLGAATDAFQAACAQLPADPAPHAQPPPQQQQQPQQQLQLHQALVQGQPLASPVPPPPATAQLLRPSSPTVPSHFEAVAEAAMAAGSAVAGQQVGQQGGPADAAQPINADPQLQAQQIAAQQQAQAAHAAAAADLARQQAAAAVAQAALQQQAAAAETPVPPEAAADVERIPTLPANGTGSSQTQPSGGQSAGENGVGDETPVLAGPGGVHHRVGGGDGEAPPRDDAMGGAAADTIVHKRGAAAMDAARAIAAKAKARAS